MSRYWLYICVIETWALYIRFLYLYFDSIVLRTSGNYLFKVYNACGTEDLTMLGALKKDLYFFTLCN